jgi:hypothetical protein
MHLKSANKKYGSSPKGLKICKPSNYNRGTFKLTIILAVELGDAAVPNRQIGSLTLPRVWARILEEAGTTTKVYTDFVSHVLDTYNAVADPTQRRTIIHNNLTSHRLAEVFEAVRLR